jgi:hypothetical protein
LRKANELMEDPSGDEKNSQESGEEHTEETKVNAPEKISRIKAIKELINLKL